MKQYATLFANVGSAVFDGAFKGEYRGPATALPKDTMQYSVPLNKLLDTGWRVISSSTAIEMYDCKHSSSQTFYIGFLLEREIPDADPSPSRE